MQPGWKRTDVTLDQVAEQPFHRAGGSTMDHHRALARSVLGDELEVEAFGELEVDLHGRVGELTAMRVAYLEVDLGAVERGLPQIGRAACRERREDEGGG